MRDNLSEWSAPYFGLTAIIWDSNDRGWGGTGDYSIGVLRHVITPFGAFGSRFFMDYATSMDLYYPESTTPQRKIDEVVRDKGAYQAPVVVVDISRNRNLQQLYDSGGLRAFGESLTNQARGKSAPMRVIFIYNGHVVEDVGDWGPSLVVVAYYELLP